ncbi:MAG: GNAT family N-acetyltransferase [Deltaproteobacteria bacterium]|nr:GNAT family N-acetyltransferase [Deltaproteobacteria bacterium]
MTLPRSTTTHSAEPLAYEPQDPPLRRWEALITASDNLYRQYQSPTWWQHLVTSGMAEASNIATVYDGHGQLLGVAPFRVGMHPLEFSIRGRALGRFSLRAVMPLGGAPLGSTEPEVHDRIYAHMISRNPSVDCLYLHSVRVGSYAWSHIHTSDYVRRNFTVYLPRGVAPFHYLTLPESFEEYLQRQFRKKKRYNLHRQLRLLGNAHGDLQCERVDSEEQVPTLQAAASLVTSRAWQRALASPGMYDVLGSPDRLRDLARRRLLRAYVLMCGTTPRAVVLGYQFAGVYHYAEIAHDATVAQFSPGSTLLYLLIKDLIEHDRPRHVNFGIGDAEYKRVFGNTTIHDASVILFRKTPVNRGRHLLHSVFRRALRLTKRYRARLRPDGPTEP